MKKWGLIFLLTILVGCKNDIVNGKTSLSKEDVNKVLSENPEYFIEAFKKVLGSLQRQEESKRRLAEESSFEESFKNPLKPTLINEVIFGNKDAPITLVEYSDFECPFCFRSAQTVKQLLKKYKGKIRFVYKHLPLDFHKTAKVAALYFEAAILQDKDKAFQFHYDILKNQRKLKVGGEKLLKSLAKKLGLDLEKLSKDIKSKEIGNKIDRHMVEASVFKIDGTPGFLLNGIPVKGAYPIEYFEKIIERLQKMGKLKL
jgi:predicted DsbA family dithiol-disulfide isomerase